MPDRKRLRFWLGLLVAGAVTIAACADKGNPAAPSEPPRPPAPNQPLQYTAVGASDAVGYGASVPCVPFAACPNGTGYVQIIARQLESGRALTLTNLGIPAAVLGPEVQSIGITYGRVVPANFIEREMPFVPRDSNVVTIFAGGNDTNAIAAAVEQGAGGPDPLGYIDNQVRNFARDYDILIRGIRDRAPAARIVVANLPNFAGLPFTREHLMVRKQGIQRISAGFSAQVNRLATQAIPVVDLMCDARSYDAANYSSDGFHPNDRGYQFVAQLLLDAINAPSYPAPRASCPQMTLVPPL